jgi:hypothetical protein
MISTDRLATFTLVTGPRGACKTLLATSFQVRVLLKAYYLKQLYGKELKVWSNYPVGFWHKSVIDGSNVYLQPSPLNMEALYTMDDDFCNGFSFIDEIDQWYDRQEWAETTQKLMNKAMTQIRKKKMSIIGTIQNMAWLNSRGQFQADIQITCREAAFSPFGRKMGLDLGECSFLNFRDLSGIMTGYRYDESWQTFNKLFWGKRFWNLYDTNFAYNPITTKIKYKLKLPTKVIEVGQDTTDSIGELKSTKYGREFVFISQLVDDLRDQGIQAMKKAQFRDMVAQQGGPVSKYVIEKQLAALACGTSGKEYTFEREKK